MEVKKIMLRNNIYKNLWIKSLFLIFIFPNSVLSMQVCDKKMNEFDERFTLIEESNEAVRENKFNYLNTYEDICGNDVRFIEKYSDSLVVIGRSNEALLYLEKSIANVDSYKGNVIYKKYELLNFSKKYNINLDVKLEWSEIRNGFLSVLKEENTVERRVHVKLAEVSIEMSDFDSALQYADKGLILTGNKGSRFLNLAAIAEIGKKNYKKGVSYLKSSAEMYGPKNYYDEPDTVFSAVNALCHIGELSIAKNILSNSLDAINYSEGKEVHDDYVRAQIVINKCNKKTKRIAIGS